jgi:hypothetical protein
MAKRELTVDQQIDAVFKTETTNGAAAAALMFDIVENLAKTRNSDPLRRFMSKARKHSHNGFKSVMGLFVRAYFGDKMVVAKDDPKHPTGTSVTLKFSGNPGPRNHWGLVRAHVEGKGHYLDREFLKTLREALNPDDEKTLDLSEQEVAAKRRIKNVIKFVDEEATSLGLEKLVNMLRQEWKDSHPTLVTPTTNVTSIDDLIEANAA